MIKDKFLVYAISLHLIVGTSIITANYIPNLFFKTKQVKLSINIEELKEATNSIQAESFDYSEVIKFIEKKNSTSNTEISKREHDLEEYRKEMQAIKNRKAEAERKQKIQEENKRKAEAERQRKIQEENKRKAESERQRKIQEERKMATQKLINQNNSNKEDYINSNQGKADLLNYFNNVNNAIQRNWIQPHNVKKGERCVVHITQSNKGEVENINFIKCPNNKIYRNEIENAIKRSSPLPLPTNSFLFDKKIEIIFE